MEVGRFGGQGAAAADPRIVTYAPRSRLTSRPLPCPPCSTATPLPLAPTACTSRRCSSRAVLCHRSSRSHPGRVRRPADSAKRHSQSLLTGVTHLGFMDICVWMVPGEPTVLQVLEGCGYRHPSSSSCLPFANGCDLKYIPRPAINQLTTQQWSSEVCSGLDAIDGCAHGSTELHAVAFPT